VKRKGSKILDLYIIRNFLGTFVYALSILMFITVIFDLSEKMDDFIIKHASFKAIVVDYYFNFIPYFALLFSPLFTFITVIFFTSKLASNSEIIAMFSNGLSFRRLIFPYFVSATAIAIFTFVLGNFVIPHANLRRHVFEERYLNLKPVGINKRNIHIQVRPNIYVYMESYSPSSEVGFKFSMEKFSKKGELVSKMMADYIRWDTATQKWSARNYYIRTMDGEHEELQSGRQIDTTLYITPENFEHRENYVETMNMSELQDFIDQEKLQGAENITPYLIEKYKRVALPFSTFILTLMGVALSSRKTRGGIGAHVGAGIGLSFAYILFMQFTAQFAVGGNINPFLAVWIPNILFAIIGGVLYYYAPK